MNKKETSYKVIPVFEEFYYLIGYINLSSKDYLKIVRNCLEDTEYDSRRFTI